MNCAEYFIEPVALARKFHELGVSAYHSNLHDLAKYCFEYAIGLDGQIAEYHCNAGYIQNFLGDDMMAVKEFKEALTLNPNLTEVRSAFIGLALGNKMNLDVPEIVIELLRTPPSCHEWRHIEITTKCNLQCEECLRTILIKKGKWDNKNMPIEIFKKIIDNLPPAAGITLQGIGEPTLHPNLFDMVETVRSSKKFKDIYTTTNALAKDVMYYEHLFRIGLTGMNISVDSLTQNVADRCRYGTNVLRLKEMIHELGKCLKNVSISIVVSRLNVHDIDNTLRQLNEIGYFSVDISPLTDFHDSSGSRVVENAGNTLNIKGIDFLHTKAKSWNQYENLKLSFSAGLSKEKGKAKCTRPFTLPFITVDGYLTPCCTIIDPSVFGYASVVEQPIERVWNSAAVIYWLRDFLYKEPPICDVCCLNPG